MVCAVGHLLQLALVTTSPSLPYGVDLRSKCKPGTAHRKLRDTTKNITQCNIGAQLLVGRALFAITKHGISVNFYAGYYHVHSWKEWGMLKPEQAYHIKDYFLAARYMMAKCNISFFFSFLLFRFLVFFFFFFFQLWANPNLLDAAADVYYITNLRFLLLVIAIIVESNTKTTSNNSTIMNVCYRMRTRIQLH